MRAAFLSRHLLLVDEVHASDPYMAALTRGLIERHLSLGGRALAMSATLGETALAILMDREPPAHRCCDLRAISRHTPQQW